MRAEPFGFGAGFDRRRNLDRDANPIAMNKGLG
jgi:hypothetical protein